MSQIGRPSRILDVVETQDPETGEISYDSIATLIIRFVGMGASQNTAAGAHGVDDSTLAYWKQRGFEERELQQRENKVLDETETAYAAFSEAVVRAEARGLMWHELNVRRAALSGKEQGGRLSLEFLARRMRETYGREVAVKHDGAVTVTHEIEAKIDREIVELEQQLGLASPQAGENGGSAPRLLAAGNGDEPRPAGA